MAGTGPLGENFEAQLINEAAARAAEDGGGASTTVRLARAMAGDLQRRVDDGANPEALKAGVDQAVQAIAGEIGAVTLSITTKEQLAAVATSTLLRGRPPGDPIDPPEDPEDDTARLGRIIAEAIDKVGLGGVITVEENDRPGGPELELAEGLRFGKGFRSPYFATDPERMEAVLDHPYVLLADTKLASVEELVPILDQVIKSGRSLLVVAGDIVGEALGLLTVNKIRGVLPVVAVRAPGSGAGRPAVLQDLAILTGGAEVGGDLRAVRLDQLGQARKVIVSKEDTIIIDGSGEPAAISDRLREIRAELENPLSDWDRQKLQERLAGLAGGVAVIKVGAPTEREANKRRREVEDAIRGVRTAVADGVVAGGGAGLLRAANLAFERLHLSGDEAAGAAAVRDAISAPMRQLAADTGVDDFAVRERELIARGILAPAKAVRSELSYAAFVAGAVLRADGVMPEWESALLQESGEELELRRPETAGQEE